jgi:hypothetical protein
LPPVEPLVEDSILQQASLHVLLHCNREKWAIGREPCVDRRVDLPMLRGMRRFHLYERMALVRRTMKEAAAAFSKSVNWSSQGRNSTRQPAPTYLCDSIINSAL